jgi:hypothetical protein
MVSGAKGRLYRDSENLINGFYYRYLLIYIRTAIEKLGMELTSFQRCSGVILADKFGKARRVQSYFKKSMDTPFKSCSNTVIEIEHGEERKLVLVKHCFILQLSFKEKTTNCFALVCNIFNRLQRQEGNPLDEFQLLPQEQICLFQLPEGVDQWQLVEQKRLVTEEKSGIIRHVRYYVVIDEI